MKNPTLEKHRQIYFGLVGRYLRHKELGLHPPADKINSELAAITSHLRQAGIPVHTIQEWDKEAWEGGDRNPGAAWHTARVLTTAKSVKGTAFERARGLGAFNEAHKSTRAAIKMGMPNPRRRRRNPSPKLNPTLLILGGFAAFWLWNRRNTQA